MHRFSDGQNKPSAFWPGATLTSSGSRTRSPEGHGCPRHERAGISVVSTPTLPDKNSKGHAIGRKEVVPNKSSPTARSN